MTATKRGITAEDLYRMCYPSDPQLSPDGKNVIFVETKMDEQRQYQSHLYLLSLTDGSRTALTEGPYRDSSPRFSPDGSTLCFISKRSGKAQLWILDQGQTEARQITNCPQGISSPVWSPDGRTIAFTALLYAGQSLAEEITVTNEDDEPKSIPVDRLKYKSDDYGYMYEKNKQVALVDIETGTITQLTEGPYDHTAGSWSPDGKWLAVMANRTANPDVQQEIDLYLIPVNGGEWKKLTSSDGVYAMPTWSPDGKKLAFIGSITDRHVFAAMKKIWIAEHDSGTITCLTADWDVQVGDATIGDLRSPGHPNPGAVWTKDGNGVYVIASENGCSGIYLVQLNGTVSHVVSGERNVYGFTYHADKNSFVMAISDAVTPGDLFQMDLNTGIERRLTEANADLLHELQLSSPEEIWFEGAEGWRIQGWILRPFGFQEGVKYPAILQIHGGPHSMYGHTFFHEFQLLAAQGYVVLYTNPRGSYGYGEHFVQACCGDYGGNDYRDLMHAVDHVCQFDYVDETRLGVAGGSYGGFMTNWIIGQDNRFKAAVTDRSICNWISFYGVSDIGYTFSAEEIQANPFADPEKMWHHSPLRLAAKMETPLLIMHGERDFRCPIEQAEQLFVTLKHQGKAPVSFIRFPKANHEMSRSGDPEQRVLRLQYTADWFNQYV